MMDSRKPIPSDYFLSLLFYNKKVISGFGFCLVASLVVCFCIVSVNTPTAISSSLFSWFDSFSGDISDSESELSDGLLVPEKIHDGNRVNSSFSSRESDLGNTHDGNRGNSTFSLRESDLGNTHDRNHANSSFTSRELDLGNTHEGNSATHNENSSGNATVVGKDSCDLLNLGISNETHERNSSKSSEDERTPGNRTRECSDSSNGRDGVNQETKNASYVSDGRGVSERTDEGARNESASKETRKDIAKTCDIFNGRWVTDERKLYYEPGSCPHIDNDFNCYKNGRPDDGYLRWRWQPYDCNIPRLNATDFLERLSNKRLIFVGDSLNRNMWESLVCILRDTVNNKSRVYEVSGKREFKTSGYYAFRFEDYNCSIDFVRSSFLVKEIFQKNINGSEDEKLRLDLIDETTSAYKEAEIIVFNTGHWWTHEKTSQGVDYYQEGNYVYPVLKVLKAYTKALNTWAKWVDQNINSNKTQVFFRGYSLTHFRGGQWNSGGQCHKETEPIFNESFLAKYPSKMRALERVIDQMRTPVIYLNISRITDYRKDGHPSIYKTTYKSVEEQIVAEKTQDCSHWCLPGIPDTWNELLYASLLMNGQGSWRI